MKFLKKLKESASTIPDIYDAVVKLSKEVGELQCEVAKMTNNLNNIISPYNNTIPSIDYSSKELLSVQNKFLEDMKSNIRFHISNMQNDIQACILAYDNIVYKSISNISNSYANLVYCTTYLQVLKEFILTCLLGKSDIISFYLYFVNTESFKSTCKAVKPVDIDRVFLMSPDNVVFNDIPVSKYIVVNMNSSGVEILSPITNLYMDSKYMRTVLRVLYSIYTDKYYLYHLSGI